jgi:hypothetical protein
MMALPSETLPCDRCRATSHGEDFAVHMGLAMQLVAQQRAVFP